IMQLGAQAISSREVMCTRDSIDIMMRFDESFGGQLYAKNFYDRTACRTGGSRQRRLQLSISHNSCGVINDIDLNTYEVTLVVQNHPDVILDGDVSYRVTCEYDNQGDSVTLDVSLDANELPVDPIVRTSFTPTLALKILPGDITRSDPVSVVEVGDDLNLVIEMLNT
ncbi:PREDICTED: uncharacterized protein LOC106820225, partial [Priapulus caudatus]|uniref:Uncharacterized protein LOC106820225 n=1 Tax=Priapulus caudatus TaxID=37621 RepID=A0ABM1F726_PRICU